MSETLTLSKKNAIKAYKEGSDGDKKLLSRLFDDQKEIFSMKITDRVKSVEDAFEIKGESIDNYTPYKSPKNNFQKLMNLLAAMMIVAEVLNEGWVADYDNPNQEKYYPVFIKDGAGFRFGVSLFGLTYTFAGVGSRFSFRDRATSDYFATQFIKIHNEILTLPI